MSRANLSSVPLARKRPRLSFWQTNLTNGKIPYVPKVVVKKSKIHGKGIFANRNFKKGDIILEIDDSHIVEDFSKLTKHQQQFECDYLGDKTVLMQSPEKYINHSCNPNSYTKTIGGTRKLIAMRDIKKGKEITYDYVINGYYESAMPCNCGSRNCRKILNCDFFQLPKPFQLKYLPYLDDWFTKRFKNKIKELKKR